MDYTLRNALVVEVKDLFTEVEIFQRGRTTRPDLQSILVIGNRYSLLSGQDGNVASGSLVSLTAIAAHYFVLGSFFLPFHRLSSC